MPFQPVLLTVAPSKSRKILRVALGRLCSLKVWLVGSAGAMVALAPATVLVTDSAGSSSW